MKYTLRESAESKAERVDTAKGIIYGVKVLSEESKNGFVYPLETRVKAHKLLEGLRVNLNHKRRREEKDDTLIQERFGKLINVREGDRGTYADVKYNIKHSMAESIAYSAVELSDTLGMSINGNGSSTRRTPAGKKIVDEITYLRSVDIVADPGSTTSLFESEQHMEPELNPEMEGARAHVATIMQNAKTIDELKAALAEYAKGEEPEEEEEETKVEESDKTALARLKVEKDCIKLCESLKHPVTADMIDLLADLPTEDKRKALLGKLKAKPAAPRSGVPLRESAPEVPADANKRLVKILRG